MYLHYLHHTQIYTHPSQKQLQIARDPTPNPIPVLLRNIIKPKIEHPHAPHAHQPEPYLGPDPIMRQVQITQLPHLADVQAPLVGDIIGSEVQVPEMG